MRMMAIYVLMASNFVTGVGQVLKVIERTYVDNAPAAKIILRSDSLILNRSFDSSKFALVNNAGEKTYCSHIQATDHRINLIFPINPDNMVIFERLISDSSGYFIDNKQEIDFSTDTVGVGELASITKDHIRKIPEEKWKTYVLNEYSSQYLFPQEFKVGINLGTEDTTRTTYFLELIQSSNWVNTSSTGLSIFWALKGRWSTQKNDKFDYTQFYPLTMMFIQTSSRIALTTGIETGSEGFGREGRGMLKGEVQFRLPFNPVDLTLGNRRWRINPVVNFSIQGNLGWADFDLPDSVKKSADMTCKVRYDIPVGKNYYLQTNGEADYSTITKQVQYQYNLSLGYIADGTIRIMAEYKQGYQQVTYQFDKQLLLGFAVDVLNESATK